MYRDELRKAKDHLELNLLRGIKYNKKGFYKDIPRELQAVQPHLAGAPDTTPDFLSVHGEDHT